MSSAVVRWEASTPSDERRHRILELLSVPERARWVSEPSDERRDRFLVGRMLLRELSADLLGLPLEAITVRAECPSCGGPHGVPRISVHGAAAPHAGLSHTTDLVVAVILPATAGSAVGIDVEAIAGSRERLSAIDELVPVQPRSRHAITARATLRRWTRVEAVLKADGRGLLVDPRAVTVQRVAGRLTASVAGSETGYTVLDRSIGTGLRRRAVVSVVIADALSGPRPAAAPEARARTATP